MGNSRIRWIVGLAIMACLWMACKTSHGGNALKKAVQSADSLVVYQVAEYPVSPGEQVSGQYYLHNYAVHGKQALTAEQMGSLKTALLDASTFDTSAVKSCPMLAKLAIDLQDKGKSAMTLVLSPSPCGKVLLFDREAAKQPISMELAPGNRLEPLVFGSAK